MVTLTEVEDEHFQNQPAAQFEDDDDYSDTGMLRRRRLSLPGVHDDISRLSK